MPSQKILHEMGRSIFLVQTSWSVLNFSFRMTGMVREKTFIYEFEESLSSIVSHLCLWVGTVSAGLRRCLVYWGSELQNKKFVIVELRFSNLIFFF